MAEPSYIEVAIGIRTSPADVLDQVAAEFSAAADTLRGLKATEGRLK